MARKQNEITILHSAVIIVFSQLVHWEHQAEGMQGSQDSKS